MPPYHWVGQVRDDHHINGAQLLHPHLSLSTYVKFVDSYAHQPLNPVYNGLAASLLKINLNSSCRSTLFVAPLLQSAKCLFVLNVSATKAWVATAASIPPASSVRHLQYEMVLLAFSTHASSGQLSHILDRWACHRP